MRYSDNDEWLIKRRGAGGGRDGDGCVERYVKIIKRKNRKRRRRRKERRWQWS